MGSGAFGLVWSTAITYLNFTLIKTLSNLQKSKLQSLQRLLIFSLHLLATLHCHQQLHNVFRFLGRRLLLVFWELLQLLGPHFSEESVRAFPAHNHPWINRSGVALQWHRSSLGCVDESIELMTNFGIESILGVLLLVKVVLMLLLAAMLEPLTLPDINCVQPSLLFLLEVLDVSFM